MLLRRRRYFALLAFLLLATPLVVGIVRPDRPELILKEGRLLAPAPAPPLSLAALSAFPGEADAYLKDHFGLRQTMIHARRDLSHPVLYGDEKVLIGRDGRMFYLGRDMVRQSAGLVLRDEKVAEAADMLAEMRDALARRGANLIVAVAPNSSTIYQDDLPLWAQKGERTTEYDLFLADLAERGVKTVDLRPVMEEARRGAEAYLMHDTHWTARSAILAFNAIAEADGHPEWRLDPAATLGPPAERKGGDAARIIGVEDEVSETVRELALPARGKSEDLSPGPMPDWALTTGRPGPTIMVIGDSFTASYFPPMLAEHVGRAIWLNHRECGFDWNLVEKFQPDEVWWTPTERFLICDEGVRPLNFAGSGDDRSRVGVSGASRNQPPARLSSAPPEDAAERPADRP
jgi:alginate O-acetyltransferase complex protein AlgJ